MDIRIKEFFRFDGVVQDKPEFTTEVVADSIRWVLLCGLMTHNGRDNGIYIPDGGRIEIEAV